MINPLRIDRSSVWIIQKASLQVLGRNKVMSCPSIFHSKWVSWNWLLKWMNIPWVPGKRWLVCWAANTEKLPAVKMFLWRAQASISEYWLHVLSSGTFFDLKIPWIHYCLWMLLVWLSHALHRANYWGCILWARVHSLSLVTWFYFLILLPLAGILLFNCNLKKFKAAEQQWCSGAPLFCSL